MVAKGLVDDLIEKCERGETTRFELFEFVSKVSHRYQKM